MPNRLLQTAGAEETSAVLSEVYGRVRGAHLSPDSGLSIERDAVGPATLDRIRMDFEATSDVDPGQVITVVRIRRGSTRSTAGRFDDTMGVGDLGVPSDPARPYQAEGRYLEEDVTTLPNALFDEVASTSFGPDATPVRLTGLRPVSGGATDKFNRTRSFVLRTMQTLGDGTGSSTQLLHGSLSRLLAASVLVAFPNTAVLDPTATDRNDARPATLRRAVAYIEANPDLDISVVDIAGSAHVSVRALQLAFRRHLNTTPLAYLRRVRLDRVRVDLRDAQPETGATVTQIATRWGFADASRFSAQYRAAYGELPSATLRR